MRIQFRFFTIVGIASLITVGTYWGIILALLPYLQRPNPPIFVKAIVLPIVLLIPAALGARWIFTKLRPRHQSSIARKVAIAFGLFTPISLGVSLPLSAIVGGYSEEFAGRPSFGSAGAIIGTVLLNGLLSIGACTFALWISKHEEKFTTESSTEEPTQS